MSRFCGEKDVTALLEAAQFWKTEGLIGEGGILTSGDTWATANIEALHQSFVLNPDASSRPFLEKLHDQLADAASAIKQLAAECLWLMLLCPSNVSPEKKRENIETIWSWSGQPSPSTSKWMSDAVLSGVGSGGPGYSNYRHRELTFFLNLLLKFRSLVKSEQTELISDPWKFAHWVQTVPDASARQLRHMLLYLLFPDDFERIFSSGDRKSVAKQFTGLSGAQINELSDRLKSLAARKYFTDSMHDQF